MSKVGELKNPLVAAAATVAAAAITAATVTTATVTTGNIVTVAATTVTATSVNGTNAKFTGLATYANDTAAKAANLTEGQFYKKADGSVAVVLAS
jgi:hypothetical protein